MTAAARPEWLLGVDIGTGSVKALAITPDGRPLAAACVEHPMRHPRPGWAENDPDDWYHGVIGAVRQLLAAGPADGRGLLAMCVVAQRDPWVLLDSALRPLRPAIAWTDQRSEPELAEFTARMGRSWLIERTGVLPIAGLGLASVLWIQRHEPRLWDRVRRLLAPKDYVLCRLTGEAATDVTTPSRSIMNDVRTGGWSAEICAAAGVSADVLPDVRWQPWQRIAELDARAAGLLGLPPGVPVAAGGGDDQAAALGAAAVDVADICAGTGTSSDWRLVTAAMVPDTGRERGDLARHAVPGRYLFEVCIESTGSSLRWFRDTFAPGMSYADLIAEASSVPPGAGGVAFLPFVDGAKRAPWYLRGAAAGFLGISSGHTRAHLTRAILEGIAFEYPPTLELIAPGRDRDRPVTLVDGEARADVWNQLKADVTGVPIRTTAVRESAALGAAILAGQAAGEFAGAADGVRRLVRFDRVFRPDPARHTGYRQLRGRYEELVSAVRPTFGASRAGTPWPPGHGIAPPAGGQAPGSTGEDAS
jgi:sugar (pentulose or hexulose) kinase